jgi:NAD(P)-dependent dehydrogenase (short-subunit alcohol dehydrogenase family)
VTATPVPLSASGPFRTFVVPVPLPPEAPFLMSRAAAIAMPGRPPHDRLQRRGMIINITSGAARLPSPLDVADIACTVAAQPSLTMNGTLTDWTRTVRPL